MQVPGLHGNWDWPSTMVASNVGKLFGKPSLKTYSATISRAVHKGVSKPSLAGTVRRRSEPSAVPWCNG